MIAISSMMIQTQNHLMRKNLEFRKINPKRYDLLLHGTRSSIVKKENIDHLLTRSLLEQLFEATLQSDIQQISVLLKSGISVNSQDKVSKYLVKSKIRHAHFRNKTVRLHSSCGRDSRG